ncbi:MAG: hypothetical protein H6765_00035 [Candidatus Peribacteria bacterium]|nr:MAG: hypothetical protein H6765_00035 [Candidatus Peribacteria bacterium]
MVYYEKLYPQTFGGIFEPLTKTIGYTHCLNLDPNKFLEIKINQFWLKFNIYTNWIEDLPVELQPNNLGDMLHILHLVSYIKNNYYDKHLAPLSFANREKYVGGLFEIHNDRLVINLADDDAYRAYVSQEFILPYNACDIIVSDWSKYPSLITNKKLFVDYLNIW